MRSQVLPLVALLCLVCQVRPSDAVTCPAAKEPLVWKATRFENQTVYLVASYSVPYSSVQPPSTVLEEVLGCADVAYFELACSKAPKGGLGSYFTHCKTYPISDEKDAIAYRLSPDELSQVQNAFRVVLEKVPASCTEAAAALKAGVDSMVDSAYRTTLQTLYLMALHALDPQGCALSGGAIAAQGMEDAMRENLKGRPIFGLRDVSMECAVYQGNTVEEDQELAQRLVSEFTNPSFLKNASDGQALMAEVMACGDLAPLANLQQGMVQLPWLRTRMVAQTNGLLAKSIESALELHPGKVVVAVLSVQHFLNVSAGMNSEGVPAILAANGFAVERLTEATSPGCSPSTSTGVGAKEAGECLTPIFQLQQPSCVNFRRDFLGKLGNDTEYGRIKSEADCERCVNISSPCTCSTEWTNTANFDQLCTSTQVGGVSGRVLAMDLTRNPGSHRLGPSMAAKTVREIFQYCYATTCNIKLQEEIALRQWYSRDPSLTLGQVALHPPGEILQTPNSGGGGVPNPLGGGSWSIWSWILAGILILLLIALLIFCFRLPKRGDKRRKGIGGLGSRKAAPGGGVYSKAASYAPHSDADIVSDSYEELKPLAGGTSMPPPLESPQRAIQEPMQDQSMSWQQMSPPPPPPQHPQQQQHQQQLQYEQQQQPLLPPPQPQQQALDSWRQQQQLQQPPPHLGSARGGSASLQQVMDNSLLQQAMQMQQVIGDVGAQAVQQMQMNSLHAAQQSFAQGVSSPTGGFPQLAQPQPGSPFGSGLSMGLPGHQSGLMSPTGGSLLLQPQSGRYGGAQQTFPAAGMYGQPPSPTAAAGFQPGAPQAYQYQQPQVYRGY